MGVQSVQCLEQSWELPELGGHGQLLWGAAGPAGLGIQRLPLGQSPDSLSFRGEKSTSKWKSNSGRKQNEPRDSPVLST